MEQESKISEQIQRILNSVEKDQKKKWLEFISTILLSAATVLSAWCVYHSSQWSGEQSSLIDDENMTTQLRVQKEIAANQRKSGEIQYFLLYVTSITNEDTKLSKFLLDRLPANLEKAVKAWWMLDPLHNPSAPASPFAMKEYVIPEMKAVDSLSQKAADFKRLSKQAGENSGDFMFLSLILSLVLFFSGISGVTDSVLSQRILVGVALTLFVVALILMLRMPIL